jgi:hypothetical protein
MPIRGKVFGLAARALTAIANDEKGVRPRWKEWEEVRGLNPAAHSITSVKNSAECFKEALTLIVQEAPDEASRNDLLELLHGLVAARFDVDVNGRASHECQARKRFFALQVKQCLAKPVQSNHLGQAFGYGASWVSDL